VITGLTYRLLRATDTNLVASETRGVNVLLACPLWKTASADSKDCLPPLLGGWLPGAPKSVVPGTAVVDGFGNFWLKITVTESNPSKAPELLQNAAT